MGFSIIIPARLGSQRLPGKPLIDIGGKPMIQHVVEQASRSDAERVLVATDSQEVFDRVTSFGGVARITSADHQSGTDRIEEVAVAEDLPDDHVVVNVQGDEPMIPPTVINQVAGNLVRHRVEMATLSERILTVEDLFDANQVKVVSDREGRALYFSRAPIPWARDAFAQPDRALPASFAWQRHLGIYAYTVGLLHRFVSWPADELEMIEKLEQLRALSRGVNIHVEEAVQTVAPGVDTEEDLALVRSLLGER